MKVPHLEPVLSRVEGRCSKGGATVSFRGFLVGVRSFTVPTLPKIGEEPFSPEPRAQLRGTELREGVEWDGAPHFIDDSKGGPPGREAPVTASGLA
jgi:hypothetical protein